jgi:hypothetical protein
MAEDTRDFLEQAQSVTRDKIGRELSPAEMGREFSRWARDDRVRYLQQIEVENRSGKPLSIREAARRMVYERELRDTHERLRRVDR